MYSSGNVGNGRGAAAPRKVTAPGRTRAQGRRPRARDGHRVRLHDGPPRSTRPASTSSSSATRSGWSCRGMPNTLPVTLDEIAYHARAVARAAARAHVVGDMPFMSYQVSPTQAVESAGKLVKDGACREREARGRRGLRRARAGASCARASRSMGHVGLMPQSVHALGGFKVQGRGDDAEEKVLADAKAIEEAGAYAIVLEAIPPDLAAKVTAAVGVPTIGIGAGPRCDGQVLVCTDLLGMSRGHSPKFAKHYAELGDAIVAATQALRGRGAGRRVPGGRALVQAEPRRGERPAGQRAGPRRQPPLEAGVSRDPFAIASSASLKIPGCCSLGLRAVARSARCPLLSAGRREALVA